MKITVDTDTAEVTVESDDGCRTLPLASAEGFALVSDAWLRAGWDAKYVYSFSWLGRPIIQLPEDMFRLQELIHAIKPDVIIETGVAHGGSLVFYAGLCKLMSKGRIVGVELEVRPHNRKAIEAHPLSSLITLVEGDSKAPTTVAQAKSAIRPGDTVMVFLDSHHSKEHVLAELDAYAPLVSKGSYIVAMDGIMSKLAGAPRSQPDWPVNNPLAAAQEWVSRHPEFVAEEPAFEFNEGMVRERVTYWPGAFLRRIK
ncbi:MAG: putative cephalosporin hydroxylase [Hyphomicrobiales bacterium]|nr:putative cephalosporin hydroxylase [Hyphomicrobiales bacterium]